MKRIKNFTRHLVDRGLLFEINRRILHPLGYALEADVDPNNRTKIVLSALIDAESPGENPEGFLYDDETYEANKAKFDEFMREEGQTKLDSRKKELGFLVQGEIDEISN